MLRKSLMVILPGLVMTVGAGILQGWQAAFFTFLGVATVVLGWLFLHWRSETKSGNSES
jgi:threonine/homoserine/homoserine lactone efflux protein